MSADDRRTTPAGFRSGRKARTARWPCAQQLRSHEAQRRTTFYARRWTLDADATPGARPVTRPLDGTLVVSLEHAIAAPFCTRQLADLGARVIKVERPGVGDFARAYDERVRGLASHFVWTNRSKESLALDVKHPEASAILAKLLAGADVLVQTLAPGAAERLGLSYAALRERCPTLIVCDISGYGADGPYRDKKAYDLLIQSESGFLSVTGSPEEPAKAG